MNAEIAQYAAAVGAALADLPERDRDDLLEDLPAHLAEVAEEVAAEGGTLADRLGPPAAYAAELRATLGHSAPLSRTARLSAFARRVRTRLQPLDQRLGRVLGYATFSEFARLLRPAWWILRGYLVAMLLGVMLGNSWQTGMVPRLQGSFLAGLLLVAACVVGSVWLGRTIAGGVRLRMRVVSGVVSAIAVVFGISAFATADGVLTRGDPEYYTATAAQVMVPGNVVVVDPEGHVIDNARLIDLDRGWWSETTVHSCRRVIPDELQQYPLLYQLCTKPSPLASPTESPSPAPSASASPTAAPSASASPAVPTPSPTS
jgi:hypothetical protein